MKAMQSDVGAEPEGLAVSHRQPVLRRLWGWLSERPGAGLSVLWLLTSVVVALFAPALSTYDPASQRLIDRFAPPSADYLLGADDLGRDVYSRLVYASRISLMAPLQAVGIATVLGLPLGLLAGYKRGWVDRILARAADAIMSIPAILLAIAIVGVLGPSLRNAMIAIGLVYAPRFLRVVRGAAISVREETFVEAARGLGCSTWWIVGRHVFPNVFGPFMVELSLAMSFTMLAEAALSFLGLGVQPPQASWGGMLGRSTRFMVPAPTLVVFPGMLIMLTVLAFNTVGDALADTVGRVSGRRR